MSIHSSSARGGDGRDAARGDFEIAAATIHWHFATYNQPYVDYTASQS
jgi:hypothetical protein